MWYVVYKYDDANDKWLWNSVWNTMSEARQRMDELENAGYEVEVSPEGMSSNYSHAAGYHN